MSEKKFELELKPQFGILRVRGSLRALSPIFHGGNEKTGSVLSLNTLKIGGEQIPVLSGNAIRGYLRRLVFKDFLNQIEYEIDLQQKGGQRLYHALFAGGLLETVSESASGVIDLALKKRVFELIPPARLFGFSYANQTIEGKLKVGFAYPICKEVADYLPSEIEAKNSFRELLDEAYQTRRDELRVEREEDEQAVQMLIELEVFAIGTMFYHEFKLEDPTELDKSCLARVIELWQMKPFIGGRTASGFGEIKLSYDLDADSKLYLEYISHYKEEICNILSQLAGVV